MKCELITAPGRRLPRVFLSRWLMVLGLAAMAAWGCSTNLGSGRSGTLSNSSQAQPGEQGVCGVDASSPRRSNGQVDRDRDGLTDEEEASLKTDPCKTDTDGDGVSDFVEVRGPRTDPLDPASTIRPQDFFVELPYQGPVATRQLEFKTTVNAVDVYFVLDTTASMKSEIDDLTKSLREVASGADQQIDQLRMGLGHFEDFPNQPAKGVIGSFHGAPTDEAYQNLVSMTDDVEATRLGLLEILKDMGIGNDRPESAIEALYQTATGEGGRWTLGSRIYQIPAAQCPTPLTGYPCFGQGAMPVVVLASDAQWGDRQGVGGHTFDQASVALKAINARFVGIMVSGENNDPDHAKATQLARDTGSVTHSGEPLVYRAEGGRVSPQIIEGIKDVVSAVPQDVSAAKANVAGNPDDFDATVLIVNLRPAAIIAADGKADSGYERKTADGYTRVLPGAKVTFDIEFHNTLRQPRDPEVHRAQIRVLGNNSYSLDDRNVYILIQGSDGSPTAFLI